MSILESEKLSINEFKTSVDRAPINTYYQVQNSDTYSNSGYSFTVKSPGLGMLLDPDAWIQFKFQIVDGGGANATIANNYETVADANNDIRGAYARTDIRYGLRGGAIFQRATSTVSIQINNTSFVAQPWKFADVMARLYVSDDQSKHEFSPSGGKFDCGNHSHKTLADVASSGQNTAVTDARMAIHSYNGFHSNAIAIATQAANGQNLVNCINPSPIYDYYMNKGFNDRYLKLADILRRTQAPNAALGLRYAAANANTTYEIEIFERVPLPPFKQYSNDSQNEMIPYVSQLTIQGQFTSRLLQNILSTSAAGNVTVNIVSNASNCRLYLKWYSPPPDYRIPAQISMPLRQFKTWYKNQDLAIPGAGDSVSADFTVSDSSIALPAIPDLLLIYCKGRNDLYDTTMPDSYHMEITNLTINIEGASGKMNQIQTIDLYNKWKLLIKHNDANITPYDEWRRYMCVAALKPEDYGCLKGPGYENPIMFGFNFIAKNHWNIPANGGVANERQTNTNGEVIVVGVYDKWRLDLSENNASVTLSNVKGNMYPAPSSIGLMELKPQKQLSDLFA